MTHDEMIEAVARALAKESGIQICDDATYALSSYRGPALAAIAAMQTDAEPVAWMYTHASDPFPPSIRSIRYEVGDFYMMAQRGWTETPLYAHPPVAAPALKPAVEVAKEVLQTYRHSVSNCTMWAAAVIENDRQATRTALVAEFIDWLDVVAPIVAAHAEAKWGK